MNLPLAAAAVLVLIVGLVHSILGEILIFRHQPRSPGGVRTHQRPFDILWATWHIATVFGFAFAALLWWLAVVPEPFPLRGALLTTAAAAYAIGGVLVFVGTRARHPGWIGMLGVALLIAFA